MIHQISVNSCLVSTLHTVATPTPYEFLAGDVLRCDMIRASNHTDSSVLVLTLEAEVWALR